MLSSSVTASPGRQHVPASEIWVQTTAAPEPSFPPFLLSTWFKSGVSLLCELSLLQEWKSFAFPSACLSPPTASNTSARETFVFSAQES